MCRELIILPSLASTFGRVASIFAVRLGMVRTLCQKDCILETTWKQQDLQSELGGSSQPAITRGSGGSATIAHGKQSHSTFTIALPSASEQLVGSICVEE